MSLLLQLATNYLATLKPLRVTRIGISWIPCEWWRKIFWWYYQLASTTMTCFFIKRDLILFHSFSFVEKNQPFNFYVLFRSALTHTDCMSLTNSNIKKRRLWLMIILFRWWGQESLFWENCQIIWSWWFLTSVSLREFGCVDQSSELIEYLSSLQCNCCCCDHLES
jgi:hypothetical protein